MFKKLMILSVVFVCCVAFGYGWDLKKDFEFRDEWKIYGYRPNIEYADLRTGENYASSPYNVTLGLKCLDVSMFERLYIIKDNCIYRDVCDLYTDWGGYAEYGKGVRFRVQFYRENYTNRRRYSYPNVSATDRDLILLIPYQYGDTYGVSTPRFFMLRKFRINGEHRGGVRLADWRPAIGYNWYVDFSKMWVIRRIKYSFLGSEFEYSFRLSKRFRLMLKEKYDEFLQEIQYAVQSGELILPE